MTALPTSTPTQAFIAGELVDAARGTTLATFEPATGVQLASIADCNAADVRRATASAREALNDGVWRALDPMARKTAMLRFADLVEVHASELAWLDAVEAGKPITDCEELDLPDAVNTLRWYAESLDKIFDRIAPTAKENLALIVREPIGVVAAVLPWNFPIATLAIKIGPALAAGNSIVVKPAEQAALSTIRIAQIASEAGIPPGVFNVVPGRGEIAGRALGLSPDVDAVTFTGSTGVGREFLRYAAESNLKRIVLECGGKSPQIVMADAARDIDGLVAQLTRAAFWNTGQNCTAGSRILVERAIHTDVVDALAAAAAGLKVGDPLDRGTALGPVIEQAALERTLHYIGQANDSGAMIAFGGRRILKDSGGWFVEPTVLDAVTPDMPVARDEIFGPVVAVISFSDEEEAIALANDSNYGLAASVFTDDTERALRMARAVRAGIVSVNCYSEGDVTTPFGGYKLSGFGGRDRGMEAYDQYTELKTIWFALR